MESKIVVSTCNRKKLFITKISTVATKLKMITEIELPRNVTKISTNSNKFLLIRVFIIDIMKMGVLKLKGGANYG